MEAKRAVSMRSIGVLAILCLAIAAMLGFAKPAQAAELKAGDYQVNATLMKADNPAVESMAAKSIVSPIKVSVDKGGNYTATVTMQGLTVTMFGQTMTSYASRLDYWNGNEYVEAKPVNYQPAPNAEYPKDVSFPLINKTKGDDETGFVKVQTENKRGANPTLYPEPVYLKIDWNTAKLVSAPVTTVTSGGVTYAISGKNATVTSISKKAKSATVKSTVKIGDKSYKVTSIKTKAAYKAKNLKKVTIQGKNLKSVGKQAFKGIAKKATFKCPKSKLKTYKKLVKAAGAPSSTIYKAA